MFARISFSFFFTFSYFCLLKTPQQSFILYVRFSPVSFLSQLCPDAIVFVATYNTMLRSISPLDSF